MTVLEVKAAVRERDGFRCTRCGMTRAEHFAKYGMDLEVHRVRPGSEYREDNSVTVCKGCHGPLPRRPRGKRIAEDGVLVIKAGVPLASAVQKLARSDRRSVSQMASLLLEEALRARGRDVPPPKDAE